ncbi:hypothetical protein KSP40_PGU002076 [Platanthera guangdongensis]|uniref:Uncharacterized protein n=1 Tax=Platanthera guangdongensis TaxID=2320717 RepID=A0ABR2N334_9ASPA
MEVKMGLGEVGVMAEIIPRDKTIFYLNVSVELESGECFYAFLFGTTLSGGFEELVVVMINRQDLRWVPLAKIVMRSTSNREGGYTRLLRTHIRIGDAAPMDIDCGRRRVERRRLVAIGAVLWEAELEQGGDENLRRR